MIVLPKRIGEIKRYPHNEQNMSYRACVICSKLKYYCGLLKFSVFVSSYLQHDHIESIMTKNKRVFQFTNECRDEIDN